MTRCSWVFCDEPPEGKGWWCAEHAARLTENDLEVERPEDQ